MLPILHRMKPSIFTLLYKALHCQTMSPVPCLFVSAHSTLQIPWPIHWSLKTTGKLLPQCLCTSYFLCLESSLSDTHMTAFIIFSVLSVNWCHLSESLFTLSPNSFYPLFLYDFRSQQTMPTRPNPDYCIFLYIKFCWNTASPVYLYFVHVCFCAAKTELNSSDRGHLVPKA